MNTNKKDYILIGILLIILIAIIGIIYLKNDKEEVMETQVSGKYVLLNDYSRFFTVNSCIYKYVHYLSNKDTDKLIKVIDQDYIEKNNITKDNIYEFFPNISGEYNYVSKKMYFKKINDDYYSYYVYGYLYQDILNSMGEKKYLSYQVNIDQKNGVFSILPYNGNLFEEDIND